MRDMARIAGRKRRQPVQQFLTTDAPHVYARHDDSRPPQQNARASRPRCCAILSKVVPIGEDGVLTREGDADTLNILYHHLL